MSHPFLCCWRHLANTVEWFSSFRSKIWFLVHSCLTLKCACWTYWCLTDTVVYWDVIFSWCGHLKLCSMCVLFTFFINLLHVAEESNPRHQLSDANNNNYQKQKVYGKSDHLLQTFPPSHATELVACSVSDFHLHLFINFHFILLKYCLV